MECSYWLGRTQCIEALILTLKQKCETYVFVRLYQQQSLWPLGISIVCHISGDRFP